jgi:16S rRNA (guanine527-N7)-methyltransferase
VIHDEDSAQAWFAKMPEYDALARDRMVKLIDLLGEENMRQNLISAASVPGIWRRHIVDSAQLLSHVPRETLGTWLDLGTGAGFPGLVIAALRPDLPVVMVESRARRVEWLAAVCEALSLVNASIVGSRLELVPTQKVAVISARAFAPLKRLLELSARFSTKQTIWLLPKGRSAAQELQDLSGWRHMFHVEQSLTDPASGIIVGRLDDQARQSR